MLSVVGVMAQSAESESVEVAALDDVAPALTVNEARAHRGFSTDATFVPRGQWIFGGTASYSTHTNDNYKFLIIDNIDSEGYTVGVSPMIAYAISKNMAIGVRCLLWIMLLYRSLVQILMSITCIALSMPIQEQSFGVPISHWDTAIVLLSLPRCS